MSDEVDMKAHTIYVGNATAQIHNFTYKVDLEKGNRVQQIPPGAFIKLSGEFDFNTTNFIIAQHTKYGMVEDTEIDRVQNFAGLCYSIDRPIRTNKLTYLFSSNRDQLVKRGEEIRSAAAIAQNEMVQQALLESGRHERVEKFEVTLQQEDHDPNDTTKQVSVGLRVDNTNNRPAPSTKVGKRGHKR